MIIANKKFTTLAEREESELSERLRGLNGELIELNGQIGELELRRDGVRSRLRTTAQDLHRLHSATFLSH